MTVAVDPTAVVESDTDEDNSTIGSDGNPRKRRASGVKLNPKRSRKN